MKFYGSPGCGSAVVEVVLQLANRPYEYVQTSRRVYREKELQAQRGNPLMAGWWESSFGN